MVGGVEREAVSARPAATPEGHLGLVDREPVLLVRRQARRRADHAVDVDGVPAVPADQVVVVVADPRLVSGG
jgi:hypothetical protein